MSFTPVVVIGLVTIGVGLSVYLVLRARHMVNKDSKPKTPEPKVGDVRIIHRGDGAYIIDEYCQGRYGRTWEFYDIIEASEYDQSDPAQVEAVQKRVSETASNRLNFNQQEINKQRKLAQKTVIQYGRIE